jgi:hypothetical protein
MRHHRRALALLLMTLLLLVACRRPPAAELPATGPAPTATPMPAEAEAVGAEAPAEAESLAAPAPAATVPCPPPDDRHQLLSAPEHGYCLLYPAEYKVEKPRDNETVLVIGGLLNAGDPRLHILVEPAQGRTAEAVADEFLAEYLGQHSLADFGVTRTGTSLAGAPAVLLDHLPGQDLSRRLITVHNDLLYQLVFSPVDDLDNRRLELLYDQIVGSLAFFPAAAGEVAAADCLAPSGGQQLVTVEGLGFCLLLPAGYRMSYAADGTAAAFFAGEPANTAAPKLSVRIEESAGRSGPQAADALLAAFPAGSVVEPVFGETVGYEPAGRLDNVPGEGRTRLLLVVYDGRLYTLTFVPAAGSAAGAAGFESFYDLVLRSFRFLPTGGPATSDAGQMDGISLQIDPALAGRIQAELVEATFDPDGMSYAWLPRHIRLTFPGSYAAGQPLLQRQQLNLAEMPQVVVFPAADYAALSADAASQIALLQALLVERPAIPGGPLPYLPLVNAAQVLASQPAYLAFQNGAGMRYLTALAQEVIPVTNRALFYTFQGLTDDGAYYVAAFFPLTTAALPDTIEVTDWDGFNAGFSGYLAETRALLADLEPAAFTPNLSLLDLAVTSLRVEPAAGLASGDGADPETGPTAAGPATAGLLLDPPAGLVYRTYDSEANQYILGQVDGQGRPQTLLVKLYPAVPAPDAVHAAYLDADHGLWLVNLASGQERQLAAGARLGPAFGWGDSHTLLVGLMPAGSESESAGFGHVAILDIASGELQVLDQQHISAGRPARSPDGRIVAYDIAPFYSNSPLTGRLHSPDTGSRPVDLARFAGLEGPPPIHLFNPAWSPDGRQVAWLAGDEGGSRLVVLDLALNRGLTIHEWAPAQFGALPPTPVWSPDGRWLAVELWSADPAGGGLRVFPADGTFGRLHALGGTDPVWLNPSQLIYADLDSDRNGVLRLFDLDRGEVGVFRLPAGTTVLLAGPRP